MNEARQPDKPIIEWTNGIRVMWHDTDHTWLRGEVVTGNADKEFHGVTVKQDGYGNVTVHCGDLRTEQDVDPKLWERLNEYAEAIRFSWESLMDAYGRGDGDTKDDPEEWHSLAMTLRSMSAIVEKVARENRYSDVTL